ncbi:MAG: DUF1232 domain-containing protein [Treponema sp.]|nr:DUF1232 domain-containing protein [Treponema sp.]
MDTITKKRALKKADELGKQSTEKDLQELDSKLPAMKKGVIAKIWDKVLFLWEQAKSPEVPLRLKLVIVGALLYLVLPIDVMPDTIPGVGLLDDLSVLLTVFREVSKYALPKLEKKIENKFYEVSYQKIDEKLSEIYKSILATTIITFFVNAVGCTILVTKPFGNVISRKIAVAIFVSIFVYALIRFIIYIKNYGQLTKKLASSVYKKKSISQGISDFVCSEYKYIAYLFDGLQIVKSVVPELKDIPDGPQIVKTFKNHYRKRIILFIVFFVLYSLLIRVTKFILFRI